MNLIYLGTFKPSLLMDELLVKFPEWLHDGICDLSLRGNEHEVRLAVPDGSDTAAIEVVVANHDPTAPSIAEINEQRLLDARIGIKALPGWATWSAQETQDYIQQDILNGMGKAEVEAWIDSNVTNLVTAKTALKMIGGELVDLRELVQKMAVAVIYLRDLTLRE